MLYAYDCPRFRWYDSTWVDRDAPLGKGLSGAFWRKRDRGDVKKKGTKRVIDLIRQDQITPTKASLLAVSGLAGDA